MDLHTKKNQGGSILRSFKVDSPSPVIESDQDENIEKGGKKTGVYTDTAENRRLNRVGQKYSKDKQEDSEKEKKTKKEDAPKDKKDKKPEEKKDKKEPKTLAEHAKESDLDVLKTFAENSPDEEMKEAAINELKERGEYKEQTAEEKEIKTETDRLKSSMEQSKLAMENAQRWLDYYKTGDAFDAWQGAYEKSEMDFKAAEKKLNKINNKKKTESQFSKLDNIRKKAEDSISTISTFSTIELGDMVTELNESAHKALETGNHSLATDLINLSSKYQSEISDRFNPPEEAKPEEAKEGGSEDLGSNNPDLDTENDVEDWDKFLEEMGSTLSELVEDPRDFDTIRDMIELMGADDFFNEGIAAAESQDEMLKLEQIQEEFDEWKGALGGPGDIESSYTDHIETDREDIDNISDPLDKYDKIQEFLYESHQDLSTGGSTRDEVVKRITALEGMEKEIILGEAKQAFKDLENPHMAESYLGDMITEYGVQEGVERFLTNLKSLIQNHPSGSKEGIKAHDNYMSAKKVLDDFID